MGIFKKICVRVNGGSGVILKLDNGVFDYVITAKHNIKAGENISIWTNNGNDKIEFKILGLPIFHLEKDLAVIKIELIEEYGNKNLILGNTFLKNKYRDFIMEGFPGIARAEKDLSIGLQNLKITSLEDLGNYHKLKMNTEGHIDFDGYTIGYSGSGIFKERGYKIYLYGIFYSLPQDQHYGRAISSNDLIKLLEMNNLPIPINEDTEFLNDSLKVIQEIKKILNDSTSLDKPIYLETIDKLKSYTIENNKNVKKIYIDHLSSLDDISPKNLKNFFIFLFFTNLVVKNIVINDDNSSVVINDNNNWIFKSLKSEYGTDVIIGELNSLIYNKYRGKKGIIHLYDLVHRDDPAFLCLECNLESYIGNIDKINSNFIETDVKNNTFLQLGNTYTDLDLKCADCFKIRSIVKGVAKIKTYNLIEV